ncbi:FAD binding domain-containing protein [Mycena floridula]|nr:FAD binding domain-containing protein [Mycena floridula]
MSESDVLIVGAGTSGLVLALTLLKNGIKPRIIDQDKQYRIGQKGAGVHVRTLELYTFLGIYHDFVKETRLAPPLRLYAPGINGKVLKTWEIIDYGPPTPGTPYMENRLIGQDLHDAFLRAELAKYQCFVELETKLESFQQHDDHVQARIVKGTTAEQVKYSWIIGADGGHSTVRKLLGLSFLGETAEKEKFVLGDIQVVKGLDTDFWHTWGDLTTKMVYMRGFALDKDVSYFSLMIAGSQLDSDSLKSREDLINLVHQVSGRTDIEFGDLTWLSHYKPSIRMVDEFRKGRVFVAGDAAHVHSANGGQGMNSGIQDSINLAWKLSLVLKASAPQTLLDSYTEERLPVIATMLNKTKAEFRRAFKSGEERSRGYEFRQLGVNYRGSSIVVDESPSEEAVDAYNASGDLHAGDRAPDAPGLIPVSGPGITSFFRLFKTTHHIVLLFSSDATFIESAITFVKDKCPTTNIAVVLHQGEAVDLDLAPRADHVLHDAAGYAYKHYQAGNLPVIVVRPDGMVGAMVHNLDGLKQYFQGIFGKEFK